VSGTVDPSQVFPVVAPSAPGYSPNNVSNERFSFTRKMIFVIFSRASFSWVAWSGSFPPDGVGGVTREKVGPGCVVFELVHAIETTRRGRRPRARDRSWSVRGREASAPYPRRPGGLPDTQAHGEGVSLRTHAAQLAWEHSRGVSTSGGR